MALIGLSGVVFIGVFLRLRAHTLGEEQIAELLQWLLRALGVAVGLPIVRWVSLLDALRTGASMHSFAMVVVPVMCATSVMQALMIGSWLEYRRELAVQNAADEDRDNEPYDEQYERTPPATARRALLAPQEHQQQSNVDVYAAQLEALRAAEARVRAGGESPGPCA